MNIAKIVAGAATLLLVACGGNTSPHIAANNITNGEGPREPNEQSCSANIVPSYDQTWSPLPAASEIELSADVISARDQLLGSGWDDPDEVKIWWYGVASFIVSAGGHLFLFDAWEIIGLHADYSPVKREDLVAIAPEAIFIGHGHFDHAGDMGYVAGHTGAPVIGGEATCATAREQAERDNNEDNFSCLLLGNADTPLPGTMQHIKIWQDMEPVSVLRHTHSAAAPEDTTSGGVPLVFVPELLVYFQNLNTDPEETAWFLQSLDDESGNSPDGGTWAYHLKVDDFTMLWHNSAGPIADDKPFGPEIQCQLNSFPSCVDVQLGTIVGFGSASSGLRDVAQYARSAYPKIHLPNHHDAWAPFVGPGAESYEVQWREEVATFPNPPEIDYLNDPEDYLRVRSYRVNDTRWDVATAGSSCAATP